MLLSSWLLLLMWGEFCSLMRRSVVSSGPFSMWTGSRCVMSVMAMAGGLLSLRPAMLWLLSGDCGVLSRRDAIRPFWYWARVTWRGNEDVMKSGVWFILIILCAATG